VVVVVAIVMFVLGIFFFQGLSKEFAPSVDRGEFMISFEMPEGATLDETDRYAGKIEETLGEVPEVRNFFLAIGLSQGGGPGKVNEGVTFVRLTHRSERERSHLQIMSAVRERLSQIPEGRAYVLEPSGPGGSGAPIQVVLQAQDLNALAAQKDEIVGWMRRQEEFVGVNANLKMNKPQVQVDINRDKASQMGITVAEISNSMRFLMGEPDISEIERGSERYEVIPEITNKNQTVPSVINDLYIRDQNGELVSLGNLVNLDEVVGPSEVHHFNRERSVTISASTPPDVVMGDALNKLRGRMAETLPAGFDWTTAGQAQDMQESFFYLTVSLVFAIVFVYLVLSGQFESWVHPLTILTALPLAAVGAYGILYALDMTFSVFTFIGTIMLVGLVTKNGILLIDYANVLMARGHDLYEAAREAGKVRFRPVLMTAVSTILGMMPIALGFGAGGEARAPMGWTVAGGMFTATGLTLLVIPVVYTLVDDATRFLRKRSMDVVRGIVSLAMVAAGLWMFSLPLQYDWSTLYFAGSWFNGVLFITLGWGLLRRYEWARYGGLLVTGVAFAKGLVFWLQLELVVRLMPAPLDPVTTGQMMVGAALVGFVALNLPGLMSQGADEE
jgi:multidrug efflux pump